LVAARSLRRIERLVRARQYVVQPFVVGSHFRHPETARATHIVNRFVDDDPGRRSGPPVFQIDPEIEKQQADRVRSIRASRDRAAWQQSIDEIVRAGRDGSNLMPPIITAVEAKATVGEIADAMRSVFGEYREVAAL